MPFYKVTHSEVILPTTPPQNNSSSPNTSGDVTAKRPTTPRGAGAVRTARENMAFSHIRTPSLASRISQRSSESEDHRPKHNFTRTLVIYRGIQLKGSLQDVEKLIVEGTVEIEKLSAKELIVAHGGHFKGNAEVDIAEISGALDGEILAKTNLHIFSTGHLNGNATCRRLQVDDGGEIVGSLDMLSPSSTHTPTSGEEPLKGDHKP